MQSSVSKPSLANFQKKHEDFIKIINLDKESAKAWKESLKNIIEIADKWRALFTDKDIDFKKRTATQEKINYYGNQWYEDMKKEVTTYGEQLKKLKDIKKIQGHYVLLQAMYKEMLEPYQGTLDRVFYVLGAYAGGISREAKGTGLYRYPVFTPRTAAVHSE